MPDAEHHNVYLDKLSELVGQENADKAIALANKAREHTASLLRSVTEAVDPAPDQRAELEEAKAGNVQFAEQLSKLQDAYVDLETTLVARGHEINLLNDTIRQLKEEAAATAEAPPAPPPEAQTDTPPAPAPAA